VIVSSTQIPHIVRRICGQALGLPWGSVRLIKPYIGGGFGNKQDALYEPLCGYCCQQVGGRLVKLDVSREETFVSNRVRHAIRYHIETYARKDGRFVARRMEAFSNQGAYASHGHASSPKARARSSRSMWTPSPPSATLTPCLPTCPPRVHARLRHSASIVRH
jgi:xanthine dehydrogenase molybdenum-binding subunit